MSEQPTNIEKKNYAIERLLELSAKRGNVYKYPLKVEDVPKLPRFRDSNFKYRIVQNAYKIWRKENPDKAKITYIRNYEKIWKAIIDEVFLTMQENIHGVHLPFQLGDMYLGTPQDKNYFVLINREHYKHIIWRNGNKYCSRDLRYYFFHSYHHRYKSAMAREDYYKTAKERIYTKKFKR